MLRAVLRAVLRALQVKLMFPLRCCTQTMLAPIMLEATPVEEHKWHADRADPIFAQRAWEIVENLRSDPEQMARVLFEYAKEDAYQRKVNQLKCQRQRRKRKVSAASPPMEAPAPSLLPAPSPFSPVPPAPVLVPVSSLLSPVSPFSPGN